jgi:hypothetical protein
VIGNRSGRRSRDARTLDVRGLSGAVGTEQADDLTSVESKRYPVQNFRAVVAKDDLVERSLFRHADAGGGGSEGVDCPR